MFAPSTLFNQLDSNTQAVLEKIQKAIDDETLASQKVAQASTIKIEDNKQDIIALKEQILSISARIRSFEGELNTLKTLCTTDDHYAYDVQTTAYFLNSKMAMSSSISYPSQYFLEVTNQIEMRMKEIKWNISGIETFFQTLPNYHVPTVIRDTLHSHHNYLIFWVAQISELTEYINELKKDYMEYRKKYFGDTSDPLKPKPEPFKYVPSNVPKTPQPNPTQTFFSGMNPPGTQTNVFTLGTQQPTTTTQPSSGGFTFGNNPAASQPANTGFNFGNLGTNTQPANTGFNFGIPAASQPTNTGFNYGNQPPTFGSAQPASATTNTAMLNQPSTGFSFGTTQPANTGFTFGNTPATNPPATTGFNFGTNQTANTAQPATGFSFGTPGATTNQQPSTGFTFGGAQPAANQPTATGFNFGTNQTAAQPSAGFSFGTPGAATNQQPSAGFSFGTNQPSTQPSTGGFTFGTNPTASAPNTGFTFGTNQQTAQPSTGFTFGTTQPASAAQPSAGFTFGTTATQQQQQQPATGGYSFGTTQPSTTTGGFSFGNPTTGFNFRS